ncbi:type II toxin-antitoxin system RelE/ParE family toxin [Fulvimarina sp. MAC8]|uniref:type II toxin-antitoxin system RelE/ParE family toxin n=1 Tax=Fulvimarina sp. MAC8 TaxID=3162874 RepID=UPI0032EC753A
MKPLRYSPEALSDLREIALYIADDSPDRAMSFVAELQDKAALAAARPDSCRERPSILEASAPYRHGRYLIFFRDLEMEIRLVRVPHGSRNLSGLFD